MLWQNKSFIVNVHGDCWHFNLKTRGGMIYSLLEERPHDPFFATSLDLILYLSNFTLVYGESASALAYITV